MPSFAKCPVWAVPIRTSCQAASASTLSEPSDAFPPRTKTISRGLSIASISRMKSI